MFIEKPKKTTGKLTFSLKNIENKRKTYISIETPKNIKGNILFIEKH
jgi:hypothetical protein